MLACMFAWQFVTMLCLAGRSAGDQFVCMHNAGCRKEAQDEFCTFSGKLLQGTNSEEKKKNKYTVSV